MALEQQSITGKFMKVVNIVNINKEELSEEVSSRNLRVNNEKNMKTRNFKNKTKLVRIW
jgi:hypothetical protein